MTEDGQFRLCSSLSSARVIPLEVQLLCSTVLSYHGVFAFPYEVEYCSFKVSKDLSWYLDSDCIESLAFGKMVSFGKMTIFIILILCIHEHRIPFHLLLSVNTFNTGFSVFGYYMLFSGINKVLKL